LKRNKIITLILTHNYSVVILNEVLSR